MNKLLLVFLAACTTAEPVDMPDAGITVDATVVVMVDATTTDTYQAPPVTAKCEDVCPDEQWFATYDPANTYQWSYCLPSYARCLDSTAPVCQGC